MKKYLKNVISRKQSEINELLKRQDESEDLQEVKDLAKKIEDLKKELKEAEEKLAELEATEKDKDDNVEESKDGNSDGERQAPLISTENRQTNEQRSTFNPLSGYTQNSLRGSGLRGTREYRTAFMEYVQSGRRSDILMSEKRADSVISSNDLGALLPQTVIQEIIKGLDKSYGQLYNSVRKLNIKGGITFPIAELSADFKRIAETGAPSDRQKVEITDKVQFSYKLGEIRIAQTLVAQQMDVDIFEKELSKLIIDAYIKAMDYEILSGEESKNEMVGILTEANASNSRIKSDHVIKLSQTDIKDWTKWQEKFFAKLPIGLRGRGAQFVFTNNTWEGYIKTLADDNNRPIGTDWYNPATGDEVLKFKGKEVTLVENDLGLKDFETATADEYFGMLWVPEKAYAINTNLEFSFKRYIDEEKLQEVQRALVINDGKVLDPAYIYLLKKGS